MNGTREEREVAIGVLFIVSLCGVLLPFYIVRRFAVEVMQGKAWCLIRSFTTGLVCSVAVMHVLADADDHLRKVTVFPMANAVMLLGVFIMVMLEEFGAMGMEVLSTPSPAAEAGCERLPEAEAAQTQRRLGGRACCVGHVHQHPLLAPDGAGLQGSRRRLVVYFMEASVAVHSVLVGLGLGIMKHGRAKVAALALALLFHQFFEGMALGMAAVRAELSVQSAVHFIAAFALSCPLGGAVGIYAADFYDDDDPKTSWVLGILNALPAGMLVHIGFCQLLAEDFGEHAEGGQERDYDGKLGQPRRGWALRVLKLCTFFAGGALMTFLAVWA